MRLTLWPKSHRQTLISPTHQQVFSVQSFIPSDHFPTHLLDSNYNVIMTSFTAWDKKWFPHTHKNLIQLVPLIKSVRINQWGKVHCWAGSWLNLWEITRGGWLLITLIIIFDEGRLGSGRPFLGPHKNSLDTAIARALAHCPYLDIESWMEWMNMHSLSRLHCSLALLSLSLIYQVYEWICIPTTTNAHELIFSLSSWNVHT